MLDSSHPEVAAAYGACEDYYVTDAKFPGQLRLCVLQQL